MWQQITEQYAGDDFELVAVAIDAQGADKPRPYMEKAGATFTCLLDQENLLAKTFGFKAVPNGIFVDENGLVVYQRFGRFDVLKDDTRQIVEAWLNSGSVGDAASTERTELDSKVLTLFDEGLDLFKGGDVDGARARWREASKLDPLNYVIHKQLWAVENPERFYGERVDMAWQKGQLEQGL